MLNARSLKPRQKFGIAQSCIRRILRIMDRDNAIRIARQYKDAISGHFNPTKVYLYGSYSKGTQREDSDIDFAVVVPKMVGDWFANVPLLWTAS